MTRRSRNLVIPVPRTDPRDTLLWITPWFLRGMLVECDLRLMSAPEGNLEYLIEIIRRELESIRESAQKEKCVVLIARVKSDSERWIIAGIGNAGDFVFSLVEDPGDELSMELKKEPCNKERVIELARSRLGHHPRSGVELLTCTQTDFVEAFFAGVQQAGADSASDAFEKLVPYRDYSEPPSAMIDVRGKALYPASIARVEPLAIENADEHAGTNQADSELAGDGVPKGDPPWLRKLYIPLHLHFHMVTTEIVCKRRGLPPVSRERLRDMGMIVRRLVPDAGTERWEDWIPCSERAGIWIEIADRHMHPLRIDKNGQGPQDPLDPVAIPPEVYGKTPEQLDLRARLALAETEALPSALSPHGLSPIPSSVGSSAEHTAMFGYLPVQSSEQVLPQLRPDVLASKVEELGGRLADRARRHLSAEFLGDPGLPESEETATDGMKRHVEEVKDRIGTKLQALLKETGVAGDERSDGDLTQMLETLRERRIELARTFADSVFSDSERKLDLDEEDEEDKKITVSSLSAELTAWLDAEQERERKPVSWPQITELEEEEKQRWIRTHRAGAALEEILGDIDERGAGAGSAYVEVLKEKGEPRRKTLLEKDIDLDEQPARGLLVFPGHSPSVDDFLAFIREVTGKYHPKDDQGSPEEPADVGAASDEKEALAARNRSRADALLNTTRARYDADSLYAVWCYARVAGRDPCEKEQLVWAGPTDVFSLAEPTDILGTRPVAIQMPNLPKLIRDLPRIHKAHAMPFAAVHLPPDSDASTGEDMADTARKWGIAWICSFGIPVFTICAWILFKIIFSILILIPGFAWLLLLRFCIPIPSKK